MSNRAKNLLLLIVDILRLFVALSLVVYSRKENLDAAKFLNPHYAIFAFIFPFWILMYFIKGVYTLRTYNPANLSISMLRCTFLSFFVSFVIFYFIPEKYFFITPKPTLLLTAVITIPLFYSWRKFFSLLWTPRSAT